MADVSPINGLKLNLPEILQMPKKLLPMVQQFDNYESFLIEGGRGSGKSHSVARFLLYLGAQRKLRIVCGREIQANIEESVFALLKDLIQLYNLNYEIYSAKGHERIVHRRSGTEFKFKGFREQGNVSIKGLEGCDILWIDEAQSITKNTLDIIMPTIRKDNARLFFTMNRFMLDDAVPGLLIGDKSCLHIQINYFENPFCPLRLKIQAENMKLRSVRDYNHIWLGQPLASADDYLFNYEKLHASFETRPFGEVFGRQRVLGIDFAAQGNDQCVATILDRVSNQHWKLVERVPWDEDNTMVSVGKIINLLGTHKPTASIIDIGGMGKIVFDRLNEVLGKQTTTPLYDFDGGSTHGVDQEHYANVRCQSYYETKEWFDQGFLCIDKKDSIVIKQLEKIKFKYRSNGVRLIQAKVDMKKELGYSPDDADSLNMAIWCANHHLGKDANSLGGSSGSSVKRVSQSKRHQR